MSLTRKVLQILNGPTVARIRFRFPTRGSEVTMTKHMFQHVVHAIRSGRVIVRPPTDLGPGTGAQYNDVARQRADGTPVRANTLEINSARGRMKEAAIVHESLHAAYDLLRTPIDANAEEASAYVCTALYLRMTGGFRPEWGSDQIWGNSGRVAQTLLTQYQKGDPGIPMVGEDEWRTLRAGEAFVHTTRKGPPAFSPDGSSANNMSTMARAFSSEVDTGSHVENGRRALPWFRPDAAISGPWRKPFRARRRSVASCGRRTEPVAGV
jgi:hypothetical protein